MCIGLSVNRVRELRNLVQKTRLKVGQAKKLLLRQQEQAELTQLQHIAANL